MVCLRSAALLSVLASAAVAAPRHSHTPLRDHHTHASLRNHHHHHHTRGHKPSDGTYPVPTGGQYPAGNGTYGGPTGSGTVGLPPTTTEIIYSTIFVLPVPAPTTAVGATTAAASTTPAAASIPGLPIGHQVEDVQPCGPPTVTLTSQETLTVTVPAGGAPGSAAPPSVPAVPAASPPASVAADDDPTTSAAAAASPSPGGVFFQQPDTSSSTASPAGVATPPAVVAPPSTPTPAASPPAATPPAASAPAPSPTPSPSATTPPAGSGSKGAKRGLSYNTASLLAPLAQHTDISWAYNWASSSDGLTGLEFVPMLWGSDTSNFQSNVDAAIASGSKYLMGMNEPDMITQYGGSDLTPGAGATLYRDSIAPFASQLKLVSPAVTNANDSSKPAGVPWLGQWNQACGGGCPVDAVALHWYGWAQGTAKQQADALIAYVAAAKIELRSIFGKDLPLWITEFSALPLEDQQVNSDFLASVIPAFEADPSVERYAFFMAAEGYLLSGSSLSSLGEAYVASY